MLFVVNKPIHRTDSQTRTANPRRRMELYQMRKPSPGLIVERVVFTAGEHLEAQQQIERRAREIWRAGGYRRGTALNDWLQAEREVLEQFIWAYARRHALRQPSAKGTLAGIARKNPEARTLKRPRTIAARDPRSTFAQKFKCGVSAAFP